MNEHADSIVRAEQQVAEARAAVHAEFQMARARLRRRVTSPLFVGGVLLGVLALGYLSRKRATPATVVYAEKPGALMQALTALHMLLR